MENLKELTRIKTQPLKKYVDDSFIADIAYLTYLTRHRFYDPDFAGLHFMLEKSDLFSVSQHLNKISQKYLESKQAHDYFLGNILSDICKSINSFLKTSSGRNEDTIGFFLNSLRFFISDLTDKDVCSIVNDYIFRDNRMNPNTSLSVCKLGNQLLQINEDDYVADLCCGQGRFLSNVTGSKHLYGCDINFEYLLNAYKICSFLDADTTFEQRDLLTSDQLQFDKIFMEYPWGYIYQRPLETLHGEHWKPLPIRDLKRSMTSWIFISKALSCLKKNGVAVVHVQDSVLSSTYECQIRKKAIELGLVKAVISLPQRINSFASVKTSLLVLSFDNKFVRFIDASHMGKYNDNERSVELSDSEINKIVELVNNEVESQISTSVHHLDLVVQGRTLDVRLAVKPVATFKIKNGTKIDDIASEYIRSVIGSSNYLTKDSDTGIRVLMSADIQDGNVDVNKLQYVSPEGMNHLIGRWNENTLKDGDVVMTNKSTTIKSAVIKTNGEQIVLFGSLNGIRVKPEKIYPHYLSTFINSNAGQTLLGTIQTGATIQMITLNNLKELIVPCPPLSKQIDLVKESEITLEMIKEAKERILKLKQQYESSFDDLIAED